MWQIDTLKLLRKDLVDVNRDLQFTFKESVEPTYRELVGLLLKPNNQHSKENNLERARNLIEDLQIGELDNFFREACINNTKVVVDEVVDRSNPNAAIIYPIILENELQVIVKIPWTKEPQTTSSCQNQARGRTNAHAASRFIIRTRSHSEISNDCHEKFIVGWLHHSSAEFNGKIDTLVFVLDGSFRNIPMSILHDGERYLIEKKYAIATSLGLTIAVTPADL